MPEYVFEASEVRVDEFRHVDGVKRSTFIGPGYNAIRLEHLATGVVVEAYGHPSQYVNRRKAFEKLNDVLFKHFFFEMSNLRS